VSFTTRAAALMAVGALSALVLPGLAAVLLVTAVAAAAVADAWLVREVPVLRTGFPPLLSRGVPAPFQVEAADRRHHLTIRQPSIADLEVDPPQASGSLAGTLVARRRGRHRLPAPATRAVGPLGLGAWYHRSGREAEIVVYPDLPAARRLALEVRQGRFRGEGRRSRGPLGLGTDLESIRDYLPDDDIRQVNWRATARLGRPMSNTYRVEQDREVVCLLDCGRLMAAPLPAGGAILTRLDAAVDVVAAMAAVADEIGDRVGVVAFDDRLRRKVSPRRQGSAAVLEAVFDLEPSDRDSDYELAFRLVAHQKRSLVLILTDLLDEAAAQPLLAAMPVLARHHAVTVASAADPAVAEAMRLPEETEAAVLRQAVAVEMVEARERVATRLEAVGARVVEAAPRSLAAACVGAYLTAKSRARL
jgi:uncharacterized protein (DUF58 family)